jgi:hypothetical protein
MRIDEESMRAGIAMHCAVARRFAADRAGGS